MKTKKLQRYLIKAQKYRIQQLRDNSQIQVNDLARKVQAVDADRQTWILRYNELEAQNKALQTELDELRETRTDCLTNIQSLNVEVGNMYRENESLKEQLGLADFTVDKLKSALASFEDLKKEADKVSSGVDVWVARDGDGDLYVYSDKPTMYHGEETFNGEDTNYAEIKELTYKKLFKKVKKRQCKKYILMEAQE